MITKQERLSNMANESIEDLIKQKEDKINKYVPSQEHLNYLRSFKNSNPSGLSRENGFAYMCTFPLEVHVKMTNIHGPHWTDKPGVLQQFMRGNPQYCMANNVGLDKFGKALGPLGSIS